MNLKKILLAVIALSMASALVFFAKKSTHDPTPEASSPRAKSAKLTEQAKKFPGLPKAKLSESEKHSECREAIESIETQPLSTLINDLGGGRLKLKPDCLFRSKNDIKALSGFPEVCAEMEQGQPTKECTEKLFLYKALRIHHATVNENIDALSTELLISKLIGLMVDQAFESPDALRWYREVANKLYERLPNSESAAKAAVVGYIADDKLSIEDKTALDSLLDETRSRFPDSWDLFEMDLIRRKSKNEAAFKEEIANFYARNPSSPIAVYYMGCLKWSENDPEAARPFFQTASYKAPGDRRFAETLQKARNAKPPEKVCSVQVGFDPDKF